MDYLKRYETWINEKTLDKTLLEQLKSLNETEIEEAFYKDLEFGTGGLRDVMGPGTNRINIYTIRRAALGFGNYLLKKHDKVTGVAISYDNRHNSRLFAIECAKVLANLNIKTFVYENLRPTPMLSYLVRNKKLSGGIMITASHNPKQYNGFKAYDETGAQLNLSDANSVIEEILKIKDFFNIGLIENDLINYVDESFDDIYLKEVETISLKEDLEKIVKIAFSPLHGTGGTVIPKFLEKMGYDINTYLPELMVDPNFSHAKSSNPEEHLAYANLKTFANEIKADVIMVTDPDADRLGIGVLHDGEYHLLSGNQTAALELYYLLNEANELPEKGFVYTTNVTTSLIEKIASSFNYETVITLPGFKFIGEKAEENKKIGKYIFGCEESYGSLVSDFVRDKDAVQAVYLLVEITNFLKHKGLTIIDYLNEIYEKYGFFYEYTENITLEGISGAEKINTIINYYRDNAPVVKDYKLIYYEDILKQTRYENGTETKIDLPKSNVLKFQYENDTWIILRPSGTEPKIKIYFGTKQQSLEIAKSFVQVLVNKMNEQIKEL